MLKNFDIAILAPLPESHLVSGVDTLIAQQDLAQENPTIAYGSMAFETFSKVDALRQGKPVAVFLYASHLAENPLNPEITWQGWYVSHSHSRRGRFAGEARRRPEATKADTERWAVYWEMNELGPMKKSLAMDSIHELGKKKPLGKRFLPKEAMLIDYPLRRAVR